MEGHMIYTNVNNAKQKLLKLASSCIKYNDVVNICTNEGNVIMLNENDYNSLVESLYLRGIPNLYKNVEKTVNTPTSNFYKKLPWD